MCLFTMQRMYYFIATRNPEIAIFGVKGGLNFKFWFCDRKKAQACADVFSVKIRASVLAEGDLKRTQK